MTLSDLKVGQEIITCYDGFYIPKWACSKRCKIDKIGRKLITISSDSFTGTFKVGINNIAIVKN